MSDLRGTTDTGDFHLRSHLFTVRVWLEQLGEGRTEWRGKVRHVSDGTVRYFRDWQMLPTLIREMLPDRDVYGREHSSVDDKD